MDSKIREALERIANECDIGEHTEIARKALLTAEPEPCEDALACAARCWTITVEWFHGNAKERMAKEIAAYTSQVADKRAEALRAQVEMLREFVAEAVQWSEAYPADLWPEPTPNQVDTVCRSLGFRVDRIAAMILRGYTMRWSDKARALLAATEPKPSAKEN